MHYWTVLGYTDFRLTFIVGKSINHTNHKWTKTDKNDARIICVWFSLWLCRRPLVSSCHPLLHHIFSLLLNVLAPGLNLSVLFLNIVVYYVSVVYVNIKSSLQILNFKENRNPKESSCYLLADLGTAPSSDSCWLTIWNLYFRATVFGFTDFRFVCLTVRRGQSRPRDVWGQEAGQK